MTKRFRCLVGLHRWRKQHNEAGQMYRECTACGKQDDPRSRISAGPGAGASA